MSKAISVSTAPIFTIFAPYVRYWIADDHNVLLFFDILRDVAMATNLVAKMGQNYLPPAFIALSIQNGMGYRYTNERINSANDASISCKYFVNFGPVTPKKTGLICILFYDMAKNWHILSNVSGYTGPIFTIFPPYESALSADDRPVPCFPICRGTWPWQSIDFWKMSWTPIDTTCVLWTIIRKRVAISLSKCTR